jgi:Na+/phosphate symporter
MDKEMKEKMVLVSQHLIKMLSLASEAFRKPTEKPFKEAEKVKTRILQGSSKLTSFIISKSPPSEKGKRWAKPYLSIASSFDRMTYNIEGILDRLRAKSENHILFSHQAVKEVNDILQEVMRLLEYLPRLITTENKLLGQRIGEEGRSVFEVVNVYSEEHEERLIQGVCVPEHSPIYLGILESLKGVTVHTLEVSGKIVSICSKS